MMIGKILVEDDRGVADTALTGWSVDLEMLLKQIILTLFTMCNILSFLFQDANIFVSHIVQQDFNSPQRI